MNETNQNKHIDRYNLSIFFILSKLNIQKPLGLVKNILRWLALAPLASILLVEQVQAQVQPIIPASDGTGTNVSPNGNQINITGGQLSRDNANLFHSFTQFGLNAEQIANFLSTPGIQNILGRVVGGNASIINGQIQVTGSNANLFLMNPAGIIFGNTASLNVPGAFTATTANGIGFGTNWFNASGTNNYADLVGSPGIFSFAMSQPGAIFNAGNLTVGKGQNLTLLGGTVVSTGSVAAPEGQILVSAVPGERLVRLSQSGSPLSLEIQPLTAGTQATNWNLPILSLPQLLTSGGGVNANKLTVNNDGKITLSGSGIPIENGDVVTGNVTTKTATLTANRNVTGIESKLQTTGDLNLLAGDKIQIRDSVANPFVAKAGGNLFIQGNQGIDILALNHPEPAFQSGGNLSLVSNGIVSGDAHFTSGGNFLILNLSGQPGIFQSIYDPVITVAGDYTNGSYEGAALKVEAGGNISFSGGIRITDRDTRIVNVVAPEPGTDDYLIQNFPALILRSQSGNINVNGKIDTSNTSTSGYGGGPGGPVVLSAPGNITVGDIDTSSATSISGDVNINSNNITTGDIKTSGSSSGNVSLTSQSNITTRNITTSGTTGYGGGAVTLNAPGDINTGNIITSGGFLDDAGNINITGRNIQMENIDATGANQYSTPSESDVNDSVKVQATGSITTGDINTSYNGSNSAGSRGGAVTLNAATTLKTGAIDTSSNNTAVLDSNIDGKDSPTSNGGNVTLTGGNIEFTSINSQGIGSSINYGGDYTSIPKGIGGNVIINANGVPNGTVKGTGTVPVPQVTAPSIPANTTILSRGNQQSGTIDITHNGGTNNVPFIVGNSTTNGTVGAIDSGVTSRIEPGSSFPVLPNDGKVVNTRITIESKNTPPTLTANPRLNGVEQDKPFTFTFSNLNPSASDVNRDNTSLRIDSITAGTLRKNGVVVVPGTASAVIVPGDTLEYTPPPGFSGDISPFTVSASDGVSASVPQAIGLNVTPKPPKPPEPPEPKLPPKEVTDQVERELPKVQTPPRPDVTVIPPKFDPGVEGVDDKFARQYDSYLGVRERRRVSLEETRDILRKIEKETGVKPAIIYVSFVPSGADANVLATPQDSDQLDLMVVTAKGEPVRKTISTAKRDLVLNLAKNLYGSLEDPDNDSYLEPAQELYKLIVAPLKEELNKKGINNLLFIADEGLRSVPFAALHDGKQYLVENYSVGFTPALSITDTRYVDIRNTQVLAMGASKFQQLNPLPAVPEELSIVAKDIWSGKFFLNQNFTLNNLKSIRSSRPFGIIHLATHGEFETGTPDNSYVQFWDSQLKLSQMRDLGLNNPTVELLVLSACRTALGDREAELGFGGFAYKAGVKTALASLWQVSDSGTLGLMTEFYKNLKKAPIKAEALRQAQLAMINGQVTIEKGQLRTTLRSVTLPPESPESTQNKNLKHPFYWSAFTMIGSPW